MGDLQIEGSQCDEPQAGGSRSSPAEPQPSPKPRQVLAARLVRLGWLVCWLVGLFVCLKVFASLHVCACMILFACCVFACVFFRIRFLLGSHRLKIYTQIS